MGLYHDREGNEITLAEWAAYSESRSYVVLKQNRLGDVGVSTIWTGVNLNLWPDGPPLIFETMIFGGEYSHEYNRYPTEALALEGHDRAVARIEAGLSPFAEIE